MTNETIKAIATALANIGNELNALSKSILDSCETTEVVQPLPKKEVKKTKKEADPEPIEEKPVSIKKKPKKQKTEKDTEKKKKLVKKTKEPTVLDRVYKVIKRSRKGATVEKIQDATKLDKKQISNSLYKLSKKGMIKTVSRGVYVPTDSK